jgi:hypothetical protein
MALLIGGAALKIKENVGGWMRPNLRFLRLLQPARAAAMQGAIAVTATLSCR